MTECPVGSLPATLQCSWWRFSMLFYLEFCLVIYWRPPLRACCNSASTTWTGLGLTGSLCNGLKRFQNFGFGIYILNLIQDKDVRKFIVNSAILVINASQSYPKPNAWNHTIIAFQTTNLTFTIYHRPSKLRTQHNPSPQTPLLLRSWM